MSNDWRKIDRGLFESPDGHWRIANPWKLTTELRHRWLVAERRASGSGWCMHDGDHHAAGRSQLRRRSQRPDANGPRRSLRARGSDEPSAEPRCAAARSFRRPGLGCCNQAVNRVVPRGRGQRREDSR